MIKSFSKECNPPLGIAGLLEPYNLEKNKYNILCEIQTIEYLFIQLIVRLF